MQPKLSLPLEPVATSPALARARAVELVTPWTSPELVADTGLLVTELVANAVFHGGSRIRLDLSVHPGLHVHAEVFDSSLDPPVLRPLDRDSVSGRGLRLVDAIACAWGTRVGLDGKIVWFELAEPPPDEFGR